MAIVYFSVATVTAEAGLLLAFALKGGLSEERIVQVLAVAYDFDLFERWVEMETAARPIKVAQVSHDEVLGRRMELSLDLSLREMSADKGMNDLQQISDRSGSRGAAFRQN